MRSKLTNGKTVINAERDQEPLRKEFSELARRAKDVYTISYSATGPSETYDLSVKKIDSAVKDLIKRGFDIRAQKILATVTNMKRRGYLNGIEI